MRSFSSASDRADLLRLLSRDRGFYTPSFYEPYYGPDGALAGYHGKRQQKMARRLVEDGIAAAVTSDAHTLEDVAADHLGLQLGHPWTGCR